MPFYLLSKIKLRSQNPSSNLGWRIIVTIMEKKLVVEKSRDFIIRTYSSLGIAFLVGVIVKSSLNTWSDVFF